MANDRPGKNEKKRLKLVQGEKFDGVQAVADLLGAMDKGARDKLLKNMEQKDSSVTARVRQRAVFFDDLEKMPASKLQRLLRETPVNKLALALRNMEESFRDQIFKNLSTKGALILKEEMEAQGPQKVSEVTRAQREILEHAARMEE
jgi:flagellar motor switch protein FliG